MYFYHINWPFKNLTTPKQMILYIKKHENFISIFICHKNIFICHNLDLLYLHIVTCNVTITSYLYISKGILTSFLF